MREVYDTQRFREHVRKCTKGLLTETKDVAVTMRCTKLNSWVQRPKSNPQVQSKNGTGHARCGRWRVGRNSRSKRRRSRCEGGRCCEEGCRPKEDSQAGEDVGGQEKAVMQDRRGSLGRGITKAIKPRVVAYLGQTRGLARREEARRA